MTMVGMTRQVLNVEIYGRRVMRKMSSSGLRSGVTAALLGAALAGSIVAPTSAQEVFTIQGGAVEHWGGGIVAEWAEENNLQIEYIKGSVDPHHTRLFQEASLSETSIGVSILLSRFLNSNIVNLFEPLDDYQAADPIEDFDGVSAGMKSAITYDGHLYGVPWRHATEALHMNMALLNERGITEPPKTFEEVLEYAERLTYTREDGTKVHGLVFEGPTVASMAQFFRSFGGDFISTDMEVVVDSPEMIAAVNAAKDLFDKGVLPPAFLNFTPGEDSTAMMQQGRVAMLYSPFGRTFNYSDPEASKFPDDMAVVAAPAPAGSEPYPAKTEFWAYVIPANSTQKDLAWDLIKRLSTFDSTVRMAIENGNGPVRAAAYDDPRVQEVFSYADAEASAIANATPPLPGFVKSAQAADLFTAAVQSVLIGAMSAEDAMAQLAAETRALLED